MNTTLLKLCLIFAICHVSKADDCYFDFEDPSEMENFEIRPGEKPMFIENRPLTPEPPPELQFGEKVLTTFSGDHGLVQIRKEVRNIREPHGVFCFYVLYEN